MHVRIAPRLLVAAGLLMVMPPVLANSTGWTGSTLRDGGGGCVGCHGAQVPALGVAIAGSNALLPGQTTRYTITVTGVTQATARVGYNAAVEKKAVQPTFSNVAGEPTATGDGSTQSTHNNAKTQVGGGASYQFDLTMPAGAAIGTTYLLYATANAGQGADQVGWDHASNVTLTVAPPTPTSLTANQAMASVNSIPLTWVGTQGEHFRVLRKIGTFATSATDAGATLVYEGSNSSATATGLAAGTNYFFSAYGKAPAAAAYSTNAAQTTGATLPPDPSALSATAGSSSEIDLTWNGTSAEFRVLGKAGAYPTSATDATAEVVYQGTAKNATDTDLLAGTQYNYRVWGKVTGTSVYSSGFFEATATTNEQPTDRHVDALLGNDQTGSNNCGVFASPCRTITHAMDMAGSGDSVLVRPGTYNVELGEVFPITLKSGVRLISTESHESTFIDGEGDPVQGGLLELSGNLSQSTRLEGFTLRNGLNTPEQGGVALGGALYVASGPNGKFTVTGNVFEGNEARGYSANGDLGATGGLGWGGAIFVFASNVEIYNNSFVGNVARGGNGLSDPSSPLSGNEIGGVGDGGAVFASGTGVIGFNTFYGNFAVGGNGGLRSNGTGDSGPAHGGAIAASGNPAPNIVANIAAANGAMRGAGPIAIGDVSGPGGITAPNAFSTNNLFFANTADGLPSSGDDMGINALTDDPKFHMAPSNLRLRLSSPANGSGGNLDQVLIDLDGTVRPNPGAARGAYEASKVLQAIVFGTAPVVSVGGTGSVSASGGNSGNAIVFNSETPSICGIIGSTVNGAAPGQCTIAANQAGDGDFDPAPEVQQSFPILAAPSFALTVTPSGSGVVTSSPEGIDCGAICTANFASNTPVTLSAQPAAGFVFAGWSGSGCSGVTPCQVAMTQVRDVSAAFTALTTFAVSISGAQEVPITAATATGSGTATIDPASNTISYSFDVDGLSGALTMAHFHGPAARGAEAGPKLTITSTPFDGSASYQEADEADILNGQWYVNYHTGAFVDGEVRGQLDNLGGLFALQVARTGTGSGTIGSSPNGIDCGTSCLAAYTADSVVLLSADASNGSIFTGWSGSGCSGTSGCWVTMSQTRSVTANFSPAPDVSTLIFANGFEN